MIKFKTESRLQFLTFDSMQLYINPGDYGIRETDTILHAIEGAFFYYGLATHEKLIVTQKQMNKILAILNLIIYRISQNIISLKPTPVAELKKLNIQAKFLSTENFDDDLEDDITIFQLI